MDNLIISWNLGSGVDTADLMSRVRVRGPAAAEDSGDRLAGPQTGPEKSNAKLVSLESFLQTTDQALRRLGPGDGGQLRDTRPLLDALQAAVSRMGQVYGQAASDMALGILNQEVEKNGAGETALSGAISKLLNIVVNDRHLIEIHEKLYGRGADIANDMLNLWNNGLAGYSYDSAPVGLAMSDFYNNISEESDDLVTIKKGRGFKEVFAHDNLLPGGERVIAYGQLEWEESKLTGREVVFADDHARQIKNAAQTEAFADELAAAGQYMKETLGNQEAGLWPPGEGSVIDALLAALQKTREEQGEEKAQMLLQYINRTFSEAINQRVDYGANINAIYGGRLLFTGFSLGEAGAEDLAGGGASGGQFYANWGYRDPVSGQLRDAGYAGPNDAWFNRGLAYKEVIAYDDQGNVIPEYYGNVQELRERYMVCVFKDSGAAGDWSMMKSSALYNEYLYRNYGIAGAPQSQGNESAPREAEGNDYPAAPASRQAAVFSAIV